jgi:rSAM/selenodomain-associated transferase 1
MRQPPQEEIIIFSRYPRAGQVKTRLIPRLGRKGAAELHAYLTEQTLARAREAAGLRPALLSLWYTGALRQQMKDWLGSTLLLIPQQGKDLGERMASAFQTTWEKGAQRAVLIGSDCPALTPALMVQALSELTQHDLVLGPASDGGYYLMARAAAAMLTVFILKELHDIDRPEDLRYLCHHPDPQ